MILQEENNRSYSWEEREELRGQCETIAGVPKQELSDWLSQIFRSAIFLFITRWLPTRPQPPNASFRFVAASLLPVFGML